MKKRVKSEPVGVTVFEAHQIASILSGNLEVKIEKGKEWRYQFDTKTIVYRTEDLAILTQTGVTANFLHEAGHAKYSTSPAELDWSKVEKENHKAGLKELWNVIEDFRIEDKLREEYPYAVDFLPLYSFKTIFVLKKTEQFFIQHQGKVPRIIQYCFGVYASLASVPFLLEDKAIVKKIELTKKAAIKARYTKSTQEVLKIIIDEIYPHIKDLLDEFEPLANRPSMIFSMRAPPPPVYEELYPTIKRLIRPTTTRFNRLLTNTKFDKFAGKFRSGRRLDEKRLYRFRLGETRLFQRKIEASTKDYVVALVVDESGSMRGEKIRSAVRTAILFSHVLDKLKIPFSLHGFNTYITHYKKPTDSFNPFNRTTKKIFKTMFENTSNEGCGYNNDGQAINEVSQQLSQFKNKKIMIVISDGYPATIGEGVNYPLEKEITRTERLKIEVIGIGIGDENDVALFYKNHVVVDKLEELPQALLTSLKGKLRK